MFVTFTQNILHLPLCHFSLRGRKWYRISSLFISTEFEILHRDNPTSVSRKPALCKIEFRNIALNLNDCLFLFVFWAPVALMWQWVDSKRGQREWGKTCSKSAQARPWTWPRLFFFRSESERKYGEIEGNDMHQRSRGQDPKTLQHLLQLFRKAVVN